MDGQNDDDYLFSGRDRSSFELEMRMAASKAQVACILEWFETTEEYFIDHFPDLAKEVTDLPDDTPTPE
ncbi:hypothetical protein [Streptomyces canus]|uniref:hypothetical protein n=1 Tax=Streptomyces canus TaxID=58343 RepID=UPI002E2A9AE1|nr:hypothetical protein [Streptomyces canus]